MMPSSSPTEKPLYSYVVATSRLAHRQSQYDASSSSASSSSSLLSPLSGDSDNETIAQKLGIADLSHLETERFQIDRRKLEKMMKTPSDIEGLSSAQSYFEKIMQTTDTFISWPRNLKLNARSRKDPFVRIVGRPNDINWAKGLIMANLCPRGPLLKMKMAISNTNHPHIIGRGGSNVNRIMEETKTHVHFPDWNRRNRVDKCNHVSIYGTLIGLKQAKDLLRLSTPLLMSFELPFGRTMARHDTDFIKKLEIDFNVKVIFFSTSMPNCYLVHVKGTEAEVDKVKEAIQLLMNYMCGVMATQTLVSIRLEISQQLYDLVTGDEKINLSAIMERTHTKIDFPDPSEITHNSQLIISGSIDGVYEAKEEVINWLPIELIFDIAENDTHTEEIMSLADKYGICITMQQKQRQSTVTVTIKAAEKLIDRIYEAHEEIVDMQITSTNEPEMPKAYRLLEPAYRRALENNINSDHSQYEDVCSEIWAPTEPNLERNFLQVSPSTAPISISICNNIANDIALLGQGELPDFEDQYPENRAILSPDSTDSSEAAYQDGRRSSDWVVMKTAEGALSEDESQHFECDFDAADLEVAFIFMSSPTNTAPLFAAAPGAEKNNGW